MKPPLHQSFSFLISQPCLSILFAFLFLFCRVWLAALDSSYNFSEQMSKCNTAIKVLRENFIKKHQVHPDYFTHREKGLDEEAFCDRDMFYPREFHRKNNHQGHGKLIHRKEETKLQPQLRIHLRAQTQTNLKITPKPMTPGLIGQEEGGHKVSTYVSIPCQPSFVKAEKLRRKVVSAREPRKPLPKYSAYIMKPCSVVSAKMQPRPQSALTRRKSQELNRYMGYGLKRQEQSEKIKHVDNYLMPWETQYEEL